MGRLLTVEKDGLTVESYTYNPNGTRKDEVNTLRGLGPRTFTYSTEDDLTIATDGSGETTYVHDADGLLSSKSRGSSTTNYVYSSRGELLSVTLPDGRTIEYLHDPLGRRIAKKVNGTITEKYLWQGMTRLLAVYDGSDQLRLRFEYADARLPAAMTRDGSTYYLSYDQVGTLRLITDATGTVVKRIDYDSFGNILTDSNPTFTIPFTFAGGLHDPDTGLVRFGYRDYDPDTGRWLAKDPIGFNGLDTNLYGYCVSDPINGFDPTGELYMQAVAPLAGFLSLMDGPLPFGEILGAGLLAGAAALDIYNLMSDKFSDEKQALVEMAKCDKNKGGISADDMDAYKELNKQLGDPFPENMVRGPEIHPDRNFNTWHGHVGPVGHIFIR